VRDTGQFPKGEIAMADAHILRIDSLPVVDRGDGIRTTPLVTKELGAKHLTTGITRFPVGAKVPMHSHNCDEQVTILEGEAEAELDGRRHRLHPYDTTLIPANKPHRFVNVGTTPLAILWIYASSEVTRTFAGTGETVAHLSERDLVSPLSPKGK
jgi:quercetin dioxygenase-like cupin family protein